MAVSKKRKGANNRPRRKVVHPMAQPRSKIWRASVNCSKLHFLKSDPDFLNLIKMGRVVNTAMYSMQNMVQHVGREDPMNERQYRRAFWIMGGYVHEGLVLVKAIQGRYLGLPEFEALRLLVHDKEHRKARDLVKAVRNVAAFHLDEYDAVTRETLGKMKLTTYSLVSGNDDNPMDSYFEFADIVDMGHLVFKFANGRDWHETSEDIMKTIMNFGGQFSIAASHFVGYLMKRTKIKEYTTAGYEAIKPEKPLPPTLDELAAQVREAKKRLAEEESAGGENLLHAGGEDVSEA